MYISLAGSNSFQDRLRLDHLTHHNKAVTEDEPWEKDQVSVEIKEKVHGQKVRCLLPGLMVKEVCS